MNENVEKYIEGLKKIQQARRTNHKNGLYIFLICVAATGLGAVFPPFALLGIIGILLFWWSHVKTARIKCPRCEHPFGTKAFVPFGVGTEVCESCGLSMQLLIETEGHVPKSHSEEWFK